MSSEKRLELIADVVDSLHQTPKYAETGLPMVRVTDVKYGELSLDKTLKVTPEIFSEFTRRYKPKKDDIIVTRVGSYGTFSRVVDANFCLGQNTAAIVPKSINPRYLYAALNSSFVSNQVEASVVGSTQKTLSIKSIKNLIIPRFDEHVETKIAQISAALDDRITLLRETNKTLDSIAQAIFKSWFVDFDPVHAKAKGLAPEGMDEVTAALFPDGFEETELGMVPTGWEPSRFGDFITRLSVGKKFEQKTASPEGLVPILDQGKSGIIGYHNEVPSVTASLDAPVVVFANHTCYMRLITFSFSAIQNVLPFVGKGVDTVWAYYATKDRIKFSEYKGHWPDFVIQELAMPALGLTAVFRTTIDPLVRQIRNNELIAQSLTSLRDTLLPRLISGKLRIEEAQEIAESV